MVFSIVNMVFSIVKGKPLEERSSPILSYFLKNKTSTILTFTIRQAQWFEVYLHVANQKREEDET